MTWESAKVNIFDIEKFRMFLVESILTEKKRAFQVDNLMYEDDDRKQAFDLANTVLFQYRVRFENERVALDYGGLEEDVAEWLIEGISSFIQPWKI
jgi:hypothetical protein